MLKRVDRVQIAVRDAAAAARTIGAALGAEILRQDEVAALGARRTSVQAGISIIELLEPAGGGPVGDFLDRWGGGLFAAGFSVDDLDAAARRLEAAGAAFKSAGGQILVEPSATFGMRAVLSAHQERAPVGLIKWIYEVTNVIGDWRAAAERYTKLFGLDPSRFVPITSHEFGYTGSLTMFDAPKRLDRIELSQITEPEKAMGRFHSKRGDSLYMFYVESDDVAAIASRLEKQGARFATGRRHDAGLSGIFIHPTAFCGVLVGVSRTENAWLWSGDPERARRAAASLAAKS
jgi:4-hydroxyphenylpyruvate dioxygenase-like putative hemolysin